MYTHMYTCLKLIVDVLDAPETACPARWLHGLDGHKMPLLHSLHLNNYSTV